MPLSDEIEGAQISREVPSLPFRVIPDARKSHQCKSRHLTSSCQPLDQLPRFLAQRQVQLRESREAYIRRKSMNIPEQTINCQMGALQMRSPRFQRTTQPLRRTVGSTQVRESDGTQTVRIVDRNGTIESRWTTRRTAHSEREWRYAAGG
jgi:hypothetical protein